VTSTPGSAPRTPSDTGSDRLPFGTDRDGRTVELVFRVPSLEEQLRSGHLLAGGMSRMGKSHLPQLAPHPPQAGDIPAAEAPGNPTTGPGTDHVT
jgi:hypothetical protein